MTLVDFKNLGYQGVRALILALYAGTITGDAAARVLAWFKAYLDWKVAEPSDHPTGLGANTVFTEYDQEGLAVFTTELASAVPTALLTAGGYAAAAATARVRIAFVRWDSYDALVSSMGNFGPDIDAGDLDTVIASLT